ncbi:large conductance mechanosensitive channel protein MscL [Clavibacter sepedonicus]|uniref:Large-conductance mechanosensitive channel n=1 Tax=Clavibacter sepedonicus TaxID=31964 RepID=B0RHA7_CLASE|nr:MULTISPECIES: large conductance mechanosensitive channel protein MscL [Clavibacter]MBD5381210.1 large conductance mechanosensitive channel protein MscL [Clavibacter sp.]OQJ48635.1 mechanosensitive ion channel protein MscL [Clavibacter sepedonicus]OQJ54179.1 mechanosensitive ion channel protein MscL [Clavibacter sepedonicus]UUK65719.1 large conductance mechanosensitive channel protein MscL [Clavibacter sepedonicus]CAQ00165.1 putative mechanosensitive channel [Clavibacter sepedonicus]
MKGFKDFILRGNVIDLAVAVVIGAAFTAIVTAIVTNVFNPLIGALFNASTLADAFKVDIPTSTGKPATLLFGAVLAALINFLIVAAVVYFALVVPVNHLKKTAFAKQKAAEEATPKDVPQTETELLIEIRDLLAGRPSAEGAHTIPSSTGQHVAEPGKPA